MSSSSIGTAKCKGKEKAKKSERKVKEHKVNKEK